MTNTARIKTLADHMASRQVALEWLNEYGVKLTGKPEAVEAHIRLALYLGDAEEGYTEARDLLQDYALIHMPEVVQAAIKCCRDDIEIARSEIAKELEVGA